MDDLSNTEKYFEIVVNINIKELTPSEKENFHSFAEFNPQDRKVSHCYFCEFPINSREINSFDKSMKSYSRLDFVMRKKYQFLKNIFNKKEIANSEHLKSLQSYYDALVFSSKAYQVFSRHSEYPVHLDKKSMNSEYKEFFSKFMAGCMTVDHLQKQIKEFKIIRCKNATSKQKVFALMYTHYIDFPVNSNKEKKIASPCFFRDISNCCFDGYKVIHHSHITREIYECAHNFCNKTVRELTDKTGQYFSCAFHNRFRFDMTFLTKGIWLSLWKTQDLSLLGSGLTTLKSYIGNHVKFIDSIKYYQQPLSKLARSTEPAEKKRISSLFLD